MTIVWTQGADGEDIVCRACGGRLYEDLGDYEGETEGPDGRPLSGVQQGALVRVVR